MTTLIEQREHALAERLDQMRKMDEWHLFQNFVLGLLPHLGYTDVRHSLVRNDFGHDGLALTPHRKPCFVAVSFDGSLAKIKKDADRWSQDENREDAELMLFITWAAPTETKVSPWRREIREAHGLDLRVIHRETILKAATREGVWRETCSRLGIVGHRVGYLHVSPYNKEVIRRGLRARPPGWLSKLIPLREWDELSATLRPRLILGRPGAGKTTTLFEQLERAKPHNTIVVESDLREPTQIEGLLDAAAGGGVIVFDDVQENTDEFQHVCSALLARRNDAPKIAKKYANVIILAAARSQEWAALKAEGKLPLTSLQDLKLLGEAELDLKGMTEDQCAALIRVCRDDWDLRIEDRLIAQAARESAKRDATPLFVISLLAAARAADDRTLRDEHLAGMPKDVLGLWRQYWDQLTPVRQQTLRLVKLFMAAKTEAQPQLLDAAAKAFDLALPDLLNSLDWLERALWITRTAGIPTCLDVQLEAIHLDAVVYKRWDAFVDAPPETETGLQLYIGTGAYYVQMRAARAAARDEVSAAWRAAARHFEAVGALGVRRGQKGIAAIALNNASVCYGALASLETTREGRRGWLDKAVQAVEEAVRIRRGLGLQADLATSVNNASAHYSDLTSLETTRDGRRRWLDKAVQAVEEAVRIRRGLGVRADLAHALNNASLRYSDLASLETTREGWRAWLDKAVQAIEEAVGLFRGLGLRANLADALNNASGCYVDLASLERTREGRRGWLDKAVQAVEEAITLERKLGVPGSLAISLYTATLRRSELADAVEIPEEVKRLLRQSLACIEEAVDLFRGVGHTSHTIQALQVNVDVHLALAKQTLELDAEKVLALCDEGIALAQPMGDEALDFFKDAKRKLTNA